MLTIIICARSAVRHFRANPASGATRVLALPATSGSSNNWPCCSITLLFSLKHFCIKMFPGFFHSF
jgi:hypothetical protein